MINNPILSTLPVYQREFIEKVSSMAVEDMKQTKILASLTTNFLKVGQVLKIPEDCIIKVYIVKPTDESLWAICVRELGNGRRYPEVKELNGMITNELTVGQQLFLPKK